MLKHIDYVYEVYREKSFSRAARNLYISQPSLSATIKKIEQEIGYPIFERNGKNITPTYIGEKYIKAAEEVLSIKNNLENEIDDLLKLRRGNIIIGSTTYIVSHVLPDILKDFSSKYPDIDVRILVEQSTVLQEKLEKGLVDIAIDNSINKNINYEYIPLFDEHLLMAVPCDYDINSMYKDFQLSADTIKKRSCDYSKLPKIDVSVFNNCEFIMLKSGNKMRQMANSIFAEKKIIPKISFEFDQLMTSVSFASSGFGICFLTDTIVKYSNPDKNIIFYQPDTVHSDRTLYIKYKKNKYLSHACMEFVKFIQDHINAE